LWRSIQRAGIFPARTAPELRLNRISQPATRKLVARNDIRDVIMAAGLSTPHVIRMPARIVLFDATAF
jgi:hypothetical protein